MYVLAPGSHADRDELLVDYYPDSPTSFEDKTKSSTLQVKGVADLAGAQLLVRDAIDDGELSLDVSLSFLMMRVGREEVRIDRHMMRRIPIRDDGFIYIIDFPSDWRSLSGMFRIAGGN